MDDDNRADPPDTPAKDVANQGSISWVHGTIMAYQSAASPPRAAKGIRGGYGRGESRPTDVLLSSAERHLGTGRAARDAEQMRAGVKQVRVILDQLSCAYR